MLQLNKLTIIYGHYGCGKTNLSVNLALDLARQDKRVTLVDLDIVNPYFRSSDYTPMLQKKGIKVVAPQFAGTNLDLPSLSAEIYAAFDTSAGYVIVDVGGDDAGAYALGRFSQQVMRLPSYSAFYVINHYRALTSTPQEAAALLEEIEAASRVKATGVINNSHLQQLTEKKHILDSLPFALQTAKLLKLPLVLTTAPAFLAEELKEEIQPLFPVERIVKPPF